ncbi:hypothetical protein, partial [Anaplasma bovis]|uniref:hypothetical protein n=1 Tax=Anaplasma bovis TaxID=186733 RepID=UPI002FEF063D
MLNYDSLVELMFSQESQKSGNMQKLFLLYLEFYYEALKEYIEIESSFSGDVITVKNGFADTSLGVVFARDIKSHKDKFDVAIDKCYELGDRARKLCDFFQAIRGKMPANFTAPNISTSTAKMLFACMSCIYAVTCSYSDNGHFVENPSTATKMLLFFVFFNSQPLREALVLQAMADEAWYIKKNERREQSFLSSVIKNLQESTGVLMRILLEPNGKRGDKIKAECKSVGDVAKDIAAALLLEKDHGIDVGDVMIEDKGGGRAEYVVRHKHYNARRDVWQNLIIDLVYGCEHGNASYLKD